MPNLTGWWYSWTSIRIYSSSIASRCEYYEIGIDTNYGAQNMLCLKRASRRNGMGKIEENLKCVRLQFYYEAFDPTRLFIQITNGNEFSIKVNDIDYLQYNDTESTWNALQNGYSGYISLFTDGYADTKAISLYISGTQKNVSMLKWDTKCQTVAPTIAPSFTPTLSPNIELTTLSSNASTIESKENMK